ncbi:Sec-independent protein translocase protein TatB [Pseudoprimorskyibacter insulae]|uniref:Sec-independent protein translocase protein TatB n=1 Tax=Pseudoprimorskyibacter insulae TaxID=1695997 RepID=A0A2R8AWW7_9RHOB|nr:Sec-independent protein translocase protein TatB [Pseudoprimorskyibacter insulae]SPF80520.1 Sec-independent protein translocase protein TatB [Pseudoprimorskyibacter insulae]
MFDLGWSELLIIGVVSLIVVGPKDLPVLFRNVGRFVGKAKGMAREFSRAMNDAANDAGVNDMAKTFKTATNPLGSAMDGVKDAAKSMTSLDIKDDPEAAKKAAEREEQRKKIEANTARMAAERKKREAEEALRKAEEMESALKADKSGDGDTA